MRHIQKVIHATHRKLHTLKTNFIVSTAQQGSNDRGEAYVDMLWKILIIVLVGAAVLAGLNALVPDLFDTLINRLTSELVAG